MSIVAACPCGARFHAEPHLAGKSVQCPNCKQTFRVPGGTAPQRAAQPAAPKPAAQTATAQIQVQCRCGRQYRVAATMAGQQVQCNACQQTFVVPTPGGAAAPAPFGAPLGGDPLGGAPFGAAPFGGPPGGFDLGGGASGFPAGGFPAGGFPAGGYPTMPAPMPMPAPSYQQPAKRRSGGGISGKTIIWIASAVFGVAALAGLIGVGVWLAPKFFSGYSSPQAAFQASQEAARDRDWAKLFGTLSPESQDTLTAVFLITTSITGRQDNQVKELLTKHGINPESLGSGADFNPFKLLDMTKEKRAELANKVPNKAAFFADVIEFQDKKMKAGGMLGSASPAGQMAAQSEGTLENLEITGDDAVGTRVVVNGAARAEAKMKFKRIGGRWYIHLGDFLGR